MVKKSLSWNILQKHSAKNVVDVLLENRGIKTKIQKEEFFNPKHPNLISLRNVKISEKQIEKSIKRIGRAIKSKERILIYGDYDTDGICATAIIWECLFKLTKKVLPYIPNRFSEGYGLNEETIRKLKKEYPDLSLIITVDNGIVAGGAVDGANDLKIDVIITDHHQKEKKLPNAYSIVHTDLICGSAIAWFFSRELTKSLSGNLTKDNDGLELAGIGTISDQLPLIRANRSIAKFGLMILNSTSRVGLKALFEEAGIKPGSLGTYEVNYVIAPRINAMGRMEHAIDSLRLICTKDRQRARDLANYLGTTNRKRQKVVEDVVLHAKEVVQKRHWKGAIILAHESYHEGVIGLAASKIVEEFWRPTIVISQGKNLSKASARSISGFDIIQIIRKLENFIIGGGGHPMAAGFSIQTNKIDAFRDAFEKISEPLLSQEILTRSLRVDTKLHFSQINKDFLIRLAEFEPGGVGNPTPSFVTDEVTVLESRAVGQGGKHLKMTLEQKGIKFPAIGFGLGTVSLEVSQGMIIKIVYTISEDNWSGNDNIQLKLKDLKVN